MDVLVLIDKLDDLVHNARPVPLTDQVRVDREEIYDILDQMRATNPEWDFMARTFTVLSAASLAIDRPEDRDQLLAMIDVVVDDTLSREAEHGHAYFLMPYAERAPFVGSVGGAIESLFIDGEIAAMLAARLLVAPHDRYDAALAVRESRIRRAMEAEGFAVYEYEWWHFDFHQWKSYPLGNEVLQ